MVVIRFRTFGEFQNFISSIGPANPNIAIPNRFHTLNTGGTNIAKMANIYAGGQVILVYDLVANETILPNDPWLSANEEMHYVASTLIEELAY